MSSQRFENIFRVALWEAYDKECFWLREPIEYGEFHIDHVIPEDLANKPELAKILADAGLPSTFDVFGHENLVPACLRCNGRKSTRTLKPHQLALALQLVEGKVAEIAKRLKVRRSKAKVSEVVANAIFAEASGIYSIDDLISQLKAHGKNKLFKTDDFLQEMGHKGVALHPRARPELIYAGKDVIITGKAIAALESLGISKFDLTPAFESRNLVRELEDGIRQSIFDLQDGLKLFVKYKKLDSEIYVFSCHVINTAS